MAGWSSLNPLILQRALIFLFLLDFASGDYSFDCYSLVVASSIGTGLIQGVILFLVTQGAHWNGDIELWPRLVVALPEGRPELSFISPRPLVPSRHSQAVTPRPSVLGRSSHSSLPGRHSQAVSPRPELSFIRPRPELSIITPRPSLSRHSQAVIPTSLPGRHSQARTVSHQSSLPGGTLLISRSRQSLVRRIYGICLYK
jgi:hypothetical protein